MATVCYKSYTERTIQVHSKWHRCKTTRWRPERHFSFRYFSKAGYHDQGFWLSTLKSGVDTESCFSPIPRSATPVYQGPRFSFLFLLPVLAGGFWSFLSFISSWLWRASWTGPARTTADPLGSSVFSFPYQKNRISSLSNHQPFDSNPVESNPASNNIWITSKSQTSPWQK